MKLDLVVCGLLLFFAVMGALTGALLQVARLGAALAASVLCRPLGALLASHFVGGDAASRLVPTLVATTVAFFGIYLALSMLARAVIRKLTANAELRATDRAAGAFFGAAKAGAIAWIVLSALSFFEGATAGHVRFDPQGSLFARLARDHNFFGIGLPLAPALSAPGLPSAVPMPLGPSGIGPGTPAPRGKSR